MAADEIARAITEAAISKLTLTSIIGSDVSSGDAEALGKKFGEIYKGVFANIVEALQAARQAQKLELSGHRER